MIRPTLVLALALLTGCTGMTGDEAAGSVGMGYTNSGAPPAPADDEIYGSIFMAEPPDSAREEGIRAVHVTGIDGAPVRHKTDRTIMLAPGTHEISFIRPDIEGEPILVRIEIEADLNYWVGWRSTEENWEPVVYIVQRR
ncbi:MAG: hypothetical protein ACR2QU_01635 [Gammaproteobacteria bacterium]